MARARAYNARLQREARGRAQLAARLRAQGKSWEEIGRRLGGVSKQRAQQLVKAHRPNVSERKPAGKQR